MLRITNCSTGVYDRIEWCCVRGGENSGRYKNYLKPHEAKLPLEFIGGSYYR
jgi:hypothetical protein